MLVPKPQLLEFLRSFSYDRPVSTDNLRVLTTAKVNLDSHADDSSSSHDIVLNIKRSVIRNSSVDLIGYAQRSVRLSLGEVVDLSRIWVGTGLVSCPIMW